MGEAPTQGYSIKFTVETGIWSKSGWEMGFRQIWATKWDLYRHFSP